FRMALVGVIECLLESSATWDEAARADRPLVELLRTATRPFYRLWMEHSSGLHLASMERVGTEEQLAPIREFIQKYGRDLFHAKCMPNAPPRATLDRGVPTYLDYLRDNADPQHPIKLIDDLGADKLPEPAALAADPASRREQAARFIEFILNVVLENYEEFKDYNATTAHAAYRQNRPLLFVFLRIKAAYERHAWQQPPLVRVHEVLARQGRGGAAELWEAAFRQSTAQTADTLAQQLAKLEAQHGLILR